MESPAASAADALAFGHAVVVIPDFIGADERKTFIDAAQAVARKSEAELVNGGVGQGPSAAQSTTGRLRLQVADRLDTPSNMLTETILRRALAFVQEHLPAAGARMLKCSASSLCMLPDHPGLEFSPGEPAVNIYTATGEFKPHEDKMGLTVLITLNGEDEFVGGGTAFWSPEHMNDARRGRAEPELVLKPAAGHALLFGGEVTHAGRPVESGTRCMFVASFSPKACAPDKHQGPNLVSSTAAAGQGGANEQDIDLEAFLGAT